MRSVDDKKSRADKHTPRNEKLQDVNVAVGCSSVPEREDEW